MYTRVGFGRDGHLWAFGSVKGHLKVIARSKFHKFKYFFCIQAKPYCPLLDRGSMYSSSPESCEVKRPWTGPECIKSLTPSHTNNDTHCDITKMSCKPSGSYWNYVFFTFYFEIKEIFRMERVNGCWRICP